MVELSRAEIIRAAAFAFVGNELDVSRDELISRRRQQELVTARALFVWIVKTHGPADLGYKQIACWLGDRDHTSIMHLFKVRAPALRAGSRRFRILCDRFSEHFTPRKEALDGRTCN